MRKIDENRISRTLAFIKEYKESYDRSPSLREIMKACSYTSKSLLEQDIRRLKERGLLTADSEGKLMFASDAERAQTIPSALVGTVHCGAPVEAMEEIEAYISLPTAVFGNDKNLFLLHASGDSMIEKKIYDGDLLVVRKQPTAEVGDIVIACLCEGEATCKTLKRDSDGTYYLHPENSAYTDIVPCEGWTIYGVVKSVIHTFD